MPPRRFSRAEFEECCRLFYSYLQTHELTKDPMDKEALRPVYNKKFKPSMKPKKFPSFSQMLYNLKLRRYIRMCGTTVTFLLKSPADAPATGQHIVDQHVVRCEENPLTSEVKFKCIICGIALESREEYKKHREENLLRHKINCYKILLSENKTQYLDNACKHNISFNILDKPVDENGAIILKTRSHDEDEKNTLKIKNDSEQPLTFIACQVLQFESVYLMKDSLGVCSTTSDVTISAGDHYEVQITYKASAPRDEKVPVLFQFTKRKEPFLVLIYLHVTITTELTEMLGPVAPYVRSGREAWEPHPNFVPGRPMENISQLNKLQRVRTLPVYEIPLIIQKKINAVLGCPTTKAIKEKLEEAFPSLRYGLSTENHKERFSLLLHMEELQMKLDIRAYDMEDVTMNVPKEKSTLLALKVPGLAEQRPSVLKGDKLYIRKGKETREYEGVVHDVRESDVWLAFDKSFHAAYLGETCNVRFTYNRHPIRLQHRAVELTKKLSLYNFPFPDGEGASNIQPDLPELKLYNRLLEENPEQKRAVQMIASGCSGPNPYIIYGPPGTGKTVTLVEALKQVAYRHPRCHILACAPSNTAADLIAQRLLEHVSPHKLFRMYALSWCSATIPDSIKKSSNYDSTIKNYHYPAKEKIMEYQFVITTLTTAGRLASAEFPSTHFTHVFIDEAGQAIEPEVLIAVAGLLNFQESCGQLVFAGDPKQLGPVLRSPIAKSYNLDVSLMERLMLKNSCYGNQKSNENETDSRFITKLLQNYRSHPAILKVPNELFYDNELKECGDWSTTRSLCRWEVLPKENFPVIFHGVIGKDEREAHSPSFFNTSEVNEVVKYVQLLLSARGAGINIKPSKIGIISPYNQQVKKIRQALRSKKNSFQPGKDATEITVASTECFQGQERLVIIISTVRSDIEYLEKVDFKFNLGFIKNAKRFNVAMTRAMALLIVVGNPHVLSIDAKWRKFIQHCFDNGAMKGVSFNPNKEYKKYIDQMKQLGIGENVDILNLDESKFLAVNKEEPAWKRDP